MPGKNNRKLYFDVKIKCKIKKSWDKADYMNLHHLAASSRHWDEADPIWGDMWDDWKDLDRCDVTDLVWGDVRSANSITSVFSQFLTSSPFNPPPLGILSQSGGIWEEIWVFYCSLSDFSACNKWIKPG
jgi:hypothetical protein